MHSIPTFHLPTNFRETVLPAKRSTWLCFFATLFMILAGASPVRAQVAASVTGTVTDPSGAPIFAATVTAKNLETAAVRIATTDDAGPYLLLSLPVGRYEVPPAKPGFPNPGPSGTHPVARHD